MSYSLRVEFRVREPKNRSNCVSLTNIGSTMGLYIQSSVPVSPIHSLLSKFLYM